MREAEVRERERDGKSQNCSTAGFEDGGGGHGSSKAGGLERLE